MSMPDREWPEPWMLYPMPEPQVQKIKAYIQQQVRKGVHEEEQHSIGTLNEILKNAPEGWDNDTSQDAIAIEYVRELEERLLARGGSLEKWES